MSWFEYGTPSKRSLRKGVWLRVSALPKPLIKQASRFLTKLEGIDWVVISEIRTDNKVLLEFWCHKPKFIRNNDPRIYKVFHLLVDEDPTWICEGDLGRGYKE